MQGKQTKESLIVRIIKAFIRRKALKNIIKEADLARRYSNCKLVVIYHRGKYVITTRHKLRTQYDKGLFGRKHNFKQILKLFVHYETI